MMIGRRVFILLALIGCISRVFADKAISFSLVRDPVEQRLFDVISAARPACIRQYKSFRELEEAEHSSPTYEEANNNIPVAGNRVTDVSLKHGLAFPWTLPDSVAYIPQTDDNVTPRTEQIGKSDFARLEQWARALPRMKRQGQRLSINGALTSLADMIDARNRKKEQSSMRNRLLSIG